MLQSGASVRRPCVSRAGGRKRRWIAVAASLPYRVHYEGTEHQMDFGQLTTKAKQLFAKRGGADSLKHDAAELKDIANGPGSVSAKAKAAANAVKDPGAPGPDKTPGPDTTV